MLRAQPYSTKEKQQIADTARIKFKWTPTRLITPGEAALRR
jgi:hypothetical protein